MNAPAETQMQQAAPVDGEPARQPASDRRADLDAKQARIATMIQESDCEGLLVLEPENFAWLTSGALARGIIDPGEQPALYFSTEQHWLIASNVDSQRLFDEELDGLGFQLKEWPWNWGREQLLTTLCQGRRVACDTVFGQLKSVRTRLRQLRSTLSAYEQACLRALGEIIAHALEACCRALQPGENEREIAGQISHRLLHRGAQPLNISVAADGRSRLYRQSSFTSTPVEKYAVLTATARKYGVHATATRTVSLGEVDPELRRQHNAACKVSATYLASTWPDAVPREVLTAGRRVYLLTGFEHEWLLCPQGHVTGHAVVETPLLPHTEDLFQPGWAITWRASVASACSCDTFVVSENGPVEITPTETWPLKRIRIQGADFFRPDILQRDL
ncbi:MAG: M24 family metallopeptidase [Gemmataceae bacterium]